MGGKHRAIRKIKRISIMFTDGNIENQGTSSDFSFTGLFIRTRKPFPPGTQLKMILAIDTDKELVLTGMVTRATRTRVVDFKNGMGVKINPISEEYKNFLKDLFIKT